MTITAHVSDFNGVTLEAGHLIALRGQLVARESRDKALSTLPGGFALKRRGNGQDVADTRAYVDGDDMRYLDRGATARTGQLHIRTFQEERDKITLLVADFRPSMLWGTQRAFRSVAAAEVLALYGWRAVEAGGRVGLFAITSDGPVVVQARARVRGMLDVIKGMVSAHKQALALAKQDLDDPPLAESLPSLNRVAPTGAEILIGSGLDGLGDGFEGELGDLARHKHPVLAVIQDATSRSLPAGQYPVRTPDGRHIRVQVSGRRAADAPEPDRMDVPCIYIDAGSSPAEQLRLAGL